MTEHVVTHTGVKSHIILRCFMWLLMVIQHLAYLGEYLDVTNHSAKPYYVHKTLDW